MEREHHGACVGGALRCVVAPCAWRCVDHIYIYDIYLYNIISEGLTGRYLRFASVESARSQLHD